MDDGRRASREATDTWFVYTGASFDIWDPDTGTYFASADAHEITGHLQQKRLRQHETSSSPFAEFTADEIPVADPGSEHPVRDRVAEIAGRLAAVDDRFAEWAAEVGVPVGSANDDATKQDLIHELDACVAHLYGLDEDDLEVIYTTFDEKRPERYLERLAAVIEHFRRLT